MTAGSPGAITRTLSAEDRPELARFTCRAHREPWTDVVEEMVREHLADTLERDPTCHAFGVWIDGRLSGVAAWRMEGDICRSILVAVRSGAQRSGLGRELKLVLVEQARAAGAVAVASQVHWDNTAMINLNDELGANVEAIPGDRDYCLCVIPL